MSKRNEVLKEKVMIHLNIKVYHDIPSLLNATTANN